MTDSGVTLHLCVINYAEALIRPAEHPATLARAIQAIGSLAIKLESPDPAVARDAARLRSMNISPADGFALATARRLSATLASFDARVRNAANKLQIAMIYLDTRTLSPLDCRERRDDRATSVDLREARLLSDGVYQL